jgi:ribose 5-phosphate isomerase B
MQIHISSDHAGFELKKILVDYIESLGHTVIDMGPDTFDASDDYPDLIAPLAAEVSKLASSMQPAIGIILGGSGQGEAIVANRFGNVRAGVLNCENLELVTLLREHNDANVLSLGARFISPEFAKEAVKLFIDTPFSNDPRHTRRIHEIDIECK